MALSLRLNFWHFIANWIFVNAINTFTNTHTTHMHTNTIVVLKQYHKNSKTLSGKISVVLDLVRNVCKLLLPLAIFCNVCEYNEWPFASKFCVTFCLAIYSHFLLGYLRPLFAVYEHNLCVNTCGWIMLLVYPSRYGIRHSGLLIVDLVMIHIALIKYYWASLYNILIL